MFKNYFALISILITGFSASANDYFKALELLIKK